MLELQSNKVESIKKKNELRVGQDTAVDILRSIFTPSQVQKIMTQGKRIKYYKIL